MIILLLKSELKDREFYPIWRRRNRVRLVDVAKYCNCSISLISQWENDLIEINDETVKKYDKFIQEFGAESNQI